MKKKSKKATEIFCGIDISGLKLEPIPSKHSMGKVANKGIRIANIGTRDKDIKWVG